MQVQAAVYQKRGKGDICLGYRKKSGGVVLLPPWEKRISFRRSDDEADPVRACRTPTQTCGIDRRRVLGIVY